jgi:uncharacterized membrane protein YeaQ/YmgE (transglycosylase-associated protein family)
MDILTWLLVGLVAGVLASTLVGSGFGLLGDIAVGIAGAFVGGWAFRELHWQVPFAGLAGVITVALVGAVLLLLAVRLIKGVSRR